MTILHFLYFQSTSFTFYSSSKIDFFKRPVLSDSKIYFVIGNRSLRSHHDMFCEFIFMCVLAEFATSMIFKKQKYQAKFSSIEGLSPTTKIPFHLRFDYEIFSFPGYQRDFQNYLRTKPERIFPKTKRIQQHDLNLAMTSLQL